MSLTIDRPQVDTHRSAANETRLPRAAQAAPPSAAAPAAPSAAAPAAPPAARPGPQAAPASPPAAHAAPPSAPARSRALPPGTEARGFALYVGIDEATAAAAGISLAAVVDQLRALTAQLVPAAETYAAVAVAAEGSGGRDVDVVRLALQDRSAVAARKQATSVEPEADGVVIDISRKRVLLDGQVAPLTYKEFELLQFLVLREGRTVDRTAIIDGLWSAGEDETPNERTIDVHVRRLRSKLGGFEEIVRTVRGVGYRFDRHADVAVRYSSTPSPDLF